MATPVIENVRPKSDDLYPRLPNVYEEARSNNLSLSHFLELEDPSSDYNDGLDAFGRQLRAAGIRTRDIPQMGIYSDNIEAFARDASTKILFAEWLNRRVREVTLGRSNGHIFDDRPTVHTRDLYAYGDLLQGTTTAPITFDYTPRYQLIAPAIPLAEVVAVTTPITGTTYESFYLVDVVAQSRFVRIAEGTEIPVVKLQGGDHVIRTKKFGRALDATYELLRRQRIDIIALHVARMAVRAEIDKLAAVIDVMVNGDGNSGTSATNYNLTTLDPSTTVNKLTLLAWLTFKAKFVNPYKITHILAQDTSIIATQLLNTGTANIPLVAIQASSGFGSFTPINDELGDAVRFGITPDAPTGKILGFDGRFSIERLVETGSDITETTKWIERQTQRLVMSINEGYCVFDPNAIKTLTLTS